MKRAFLDSTVSRYLLLFGGPEGLQVPDELLRLVSLVQLEEAASCVGAQHLLQTSRWGGHNVNTEREKQAKRVKPVSEPNPTNDERKRENGSNQRQDGSNQNPSQIRPMTRERGKAGQTRDKTGQTRIRAKSEENRVISTNDSPAHRLSVSFFEKPARCGQANIWQPGSPNLLSYLLSIRYVFKCATTVEFLDKVGSFAKTSLAPGNISEEKWDKLISITKYEVAFTSEPGWKLRPGSRPCGRNSF